MLQTAIALLLAHLLADFILQSNAMVQAKARPAILLQHVIIVAVATWLALGLSPAWALLALITLSHFLIDWAKSRWGGPGFLAFAADQTAHMMMIALGAALFPAAWAEGFWAAPEVLARIPWLANLPRGMILAAGLIATVWAGGYAVAALMSGMDQSAPEPGDDSGLPLGGQMIGRLERLMILIMVLSQQTAAIGLLIAAKSILRFGEASRSRRASEYVIIGTLASVVWALGVAYLIVTLLGAT